MLQIMKCLAGTLTVTALLFLTGCESVSYVTSELSGQAKPEGGITETVPPTKSFTGNAQMIKRAALSVLEDQGYMAEELANGTIRTEPKPLGDPGKFALMGASYSAKVTLKLEGQTVTFRARFDKKSNVTLAEQNLEYPEKENELRKVFFAALEKKIGR